VATKAERAEAAAAARATLKRDKRMNIRVSSMDMLGLQTKAAKLGMPYQTLIASILHKYVTGRLEERRLPVAAPVESKGRIRRRTSQSDF
jgi:hypothetical protein